MGFNRLKHGWGKVKFQNSESDYVKGFKYYKQNLNVLFSAINA